MSKSAPERALPSRLPSFQAKPSSLDPGCPGRSYSGALNLGPGAKPAPLRAGRRQRGWQRKPLWFLPKATFRACHHRAPQGYPIAQPACLS